MALYCYLQKQTSGTLDDVVVKIEGKPLNNVGSAQDQSVTYTTSGSITEARYRDIEHKKLIDYGDLSTKEISWIIDYPLVNMKQIRVSAKHMSRTIK